jgi:60 kDa SS-A/Ro ribonucleoprotein
MVSVNKKAAGPMTHEGAPARRLTPLEALRRSVLACLLWEDTFYEDGEQIGERIARLVNDVKPEEVAALAVEAREQMKLRHAPLWLARGLAKRRSPLVSPTLERVIQRPDELAEFLALYWAGGKQPISAAAKRGLAAAFTKFDAYQLAKYDRRGMAIKLRDVMFLVHPKPKDAAQAATWKDLAEGTLDTPDTWEVALSTGDDPRDAWTRLLVGHKLGALALLRNLRNMQEVGVALDLVREALRTMKVARVLPFRFITAARHAPELQPELEQAMLRSAAELPKLPGRTVLVVDHSGSMTGAPVSRRSELDRFDAARALAMLAREQCENVVIVVFGSNAKLVPRNLRGFELSRALARGPGGATNTEQAKRLADREGYDRIIIITDEQSHQAISAPQGRGYVINVAPYEHGIGYGAWTHVDGWSEAVLSYVAATEDLSFEPAASDEE